MDVPVHWQFNLILTEVTSSDLRKRGFRHKAVEWSRKPLSYIDVDGWAGARPLKGLPRPNPYYVART
jgi:hypothetical protein